MDWLQAVILALIQGVTEFLPVSSQAHLVIYAWISGEQYQGLDFDIILHAGSLLAVVWYFHRDLISMAGAWLGSFAGRGNGRDARLAWWVIIATIPAGVLGFLLKDAAEDGLRAVWIMAISLIVFGLILGWADLRGGRHRDEYQLGLKDVVIIGLAQALALIPGTSRSGITMTAALFLGLSRAAAARFSFLMSIPVIAGAVVLGLRDLLTAATAPWDLLLLGFVVSAVVSYICIHYFLTFISRMGMQPFVAWRVALGLILFALML